MLAMTTRTLALAVAIALAGCATPGESTQTPKFAAPELAPAASARLAPISIDRWWTLFGDPGLERLIEEALAHNADRELALARVREALATLEIARAAQLPTLDAKASASRAQQPQTPGLNRRSSRYQASLEGSYDVD